MPFNDDWPRWQVFSLKKISCIAEGIVEEFLSVFPPKSSMIHVKWVSYSSVHIDTRLSLPFANGPDTHKLEPSSLDGDIHLLRWVHFPHTNVKLKTLDDWGQEGWALSTCDAIMFLFLFLFFLALIESNCKQDLRWIEISNSVKLNMLLSRYIWDSDRNGHGMIRK